MRILLLLALLVFGSATAQPIRPDVYRHSNGEPPSGMDKRILDAYRSYFNIIEIQGEGYVPPQPIAGAMAGEAVGPAGETVTGHVVVAFLVTADGRAAQPQIMESTDRRLNPYAVRSVTLWHFKPATYKGKAVTTIAAQEFNFK